MTNKNADRTRATVRRKMPRVQSADIKRVIACTDQLVELALQADWLAVLERIDERRRLLQDIVDLDPHLDNPRVAALNEAVCESEQALARVMAHAIASSRSPAGAFALHH